MNFAIQTLQYTLSCHSEDIAEAERRLKQATAKVSKDYYLKEIQTLESNSKELKQAIKFLNSKIK